MYSGASRKFSLVLEIENYLSVLLRFREKTERSQSRNKGMDPLVLEIWLKATYHFSNTKDQLQEYVASICVEIKE